MIAGVTVVAVLALGWALTDRGDAPDPRTPVTTGAASGALSDSEPAEPPSPDAPVPIVGIVEALQTRWQPMSFEDDMTITNIAGESGRVVAVGRDSEAPVVLVSTVGPLWNPVDTFEPPVGAVEFVDLVTHGNELVAFGFVDGLLATWNARSAFDWTYAGPTAALVWVDEVVAAASDGTRVMLLGATAFGLQTWISEDGIDWAHAGTVPIESGRFGRPAALTTHDGWFYVGGARCQEDTCRPAVMRSRDGSTWRAAGPRLGHGRGVIDEAVGAVTAMATSRSGPVAAGIVSRSGDEQPAIWLSDDGHEWQRAPTEAATTGSVVELQLVDTDTTVPSTARIAVGGDTFTLGLGEGVETTIGRLDIERIADRSITLNVAGERRQLRAGAALRVNPDVTINAIDAQAKRVVAVGEERFGERSIPVAWTSWDSGVGWERVVLPAGTSAAAESVVVDRGRIVAHGVSSDGALAWAGRWDDATEAFLAERQARSLLDAIESNDTARVVSVLELTEPPPGFASPLTLPGLSPVDLRHRWWDATRAVTNEEGIAATLGYVDAIGARTVISTCRSTVVLAAIERVVTSCRYRTSSDLFDVLGIESVTGELVVTIEDGMVTGIESADDASELIATWSVMIDLVADRDPTAVAAPGDEAPTGTPLLTSDTAALHLSLAADVANSMLLPGERLVAETDLGRIQWLWIRPEAGRGTAISFVGVWSDELVVTGWHEDGTVGVWRSTHGFVWEEIPAPASQWLGEVRPFNDGLLAVGQDGRGSRMWFFDGESWTSIDVGSADSFDRGLNVLAVSDQAALIQTWRWDRQSQDLADVQFGRLGAELVFEPVAGPPDDAFLREVGSIDGGTLVVSEHTDPTRDRRLWWTSDFLTWEERGVADGLGQGHPQFHTSARGFIALEHLEGDGCRPAGAGRICAPPTRTLISEDGRRWIESAPFDLATGGPTIIGSGSPGVVGVTQAWIDTEDGGPAPMTLWLSADGASWSRLTAPIPFDPEADWAGPIGVVVLDDRVIIPIDSAQGPTQQASVLVGEFIDR